MMLILFAFIYLHVLNIRSIVTITCLYFERLQINFWS